MRTLPQIQLASIGGNARDSLPDQSAGEAERGRALPAPPAMLQHSPPEKIC